MAGGKGFLIGFSGIVLAFAVAGLLWPRGGVLKEDALPGGEPGPLSSNRKGAVPSGMGDLPGRTGKEGARRSLGFVKLVENTTGKPLGGMRIVLQSVKGGKIEVETEEDGSFPRPPAGEYILSPKDWGFRPTRRKIGPESKVIPVEGLGRIALSLKGEHPGVGAASLLPSRYLKELLEKRESIPNPGSFAPDSPSFSRDLKEAWEKEKRSFYPGTESLAWEQVPAGRKYILVVSHQRIYKVSPPSPKWAGILFDVAAGGEKGKGFLLPQAGFKPPCPISRSLAVEGGKVLPAEAFFHAWATLFIFCDSFREGSHVTMTLSMAQSREKEGIFGWHPVFEYWGKPKETMEIQRLFPGDYLLQASCLFKRGKRVVFSCLSVKIDKEGAVKVHVSRGIGPYSLDVSSPSGRWEQGMLLVLESSGGVNWPHFMGEGAFEFPGTVEGELEIEGVLGRKGRVRLDAEQGGWFSAMFDLGKSKRVLLK